MRRPLAGLLLAVCVVTGCGGAGTTDRAPTVVVQALSRVDSEVAARDWPAVRQALDDLVRRTLLARRSGELSEAHADRILAAAAELRSGVPASSPAPTTRPTASPSPTAHRAVAPAPTEADEPARKPRGKGKGKGR